MLTLRVRRLLRWVLVASLIASAQTAGASVSAQESTRPNVILIVTDDQRSGTVSRYQPAVRSLIGAQGITFSNAVVTNPLCCPSRASILTGLYPHSHGVYGNKAATGFSAFDDRSTIATWMHDAGYRTALIGKYLNGYGEVYPNGDYVPPGWDRWFSFLDTAYYDYSVSDDGQRVEFGSAPEDYSTDVLTDVADSFIRNSDGPFFLYLAYNAPHEPFVPSPDHAGTFADLPSYRSPSWNERDVDDKPAWVRRLPRLSPEEQARQDALRRAQLETLLSVQDGVQRLVSTLDELGELSDTLIVYTSDNGFQWGEHRIWGKNVAYRNSTDVPLLMRDDAMIPPDLVQDQVVANIDIAPTIAELAGVPTPPTDGLSLAPLFDPTGALSRVRVLIEHGLGGKSPPLCAVRDDTEFYVRYATGEEEYYDLTLDPYELDNAAYDPTSRDRVRALRNAAKRLCQPLPPGMTW
jgi:N-acetylglucosamine-6-sulfatase